MPDITGNVGFNYSASALQQAAADAKRLSESLAAVNKSLGETGSAGGSAGKGIDNTSLALNNVLNISSQVKGQLAEVWGTMGDAVAVSSEYEKTLAGVSTLSEEAAAMQGQYEKQILQVSTALGVDAVQSANALYDALSSGVPAENAVSFMETASKAAVAGATNTEASVRGITTALNAWKLDASEAGQVSDVFFQGVNVGVFRFEELSSSLGKVAPLAAAVGVGYKEVTAATASLTKQGLSASEAMTQQRASITALLTPNVQMQGVLKQLAVDHSDVARAASEQGISLGEAALRTLGYQGTMEAVRESSKNAGIELSTATGSVQALGAVLGLTGENAEAARADLDTMTNSAGSTDRAFAIMEETFSGTQAKLEALKQQGMIGLGDAIQSALLPAMRAALEILGPIVQWFTNLGDGTKQGVGTMLLLASGLGTLVASLVLGKAALDALHVSSILAATGMSTLQMAMVTTGIGAVIVVLGLLVKGMADLSAAYDKQFQSVQKMEGGFDAYLAGVRRAQQETGFWGKTMAFIEQESFRTDLQVRKAGMAYLEYSLGVDKSVLSSRGFLVEQDKLRQSFRDGDISQEQYQAKLVTLADKYSVAAGKGHVLSESQRETADAWVKSTSALAQHEAGISQATLKSEQFQAQARIFAAAIESGELSAEEATQKLLAYGGALDTVAAKAGESARAQAEAQGVLQSYGSAFDELLRAGSQWTEDAEAMAAAQEKADDAMASSVQQTLGSIWQAHKDLPGKLAAARAQDAAAAASANQKRADQEKAHGDKMADLQFRLDNAKGESAQRSAQRAIEKEQEKWAVLNATAATGGGSQTAAVQAEYDKQLAAAKESLAQTVVEYVKTQVMLGQTSEETARAIFTQLKTAFPGVEIINPVEEASLGLMAAVHDAAAGVEGGLERIVPSIQNIDLAMQEQAARDFELTNVVVDNASERAAALAAEGDAAGSAAASKQATDAAVAFAAGDRSQAVLDALGAEGVKQLETQLQTEGAASGITTAFDQVKLSAQERALVTGQALTDEQLSMIATSGVAATEGAKTGSAMIGVGKDTKTGAADVRTATGDMKGDFSSMPAAANKAADDMKGAASGIGESFAVAGDKIAQSQRSGLMALEESLTRQQTAKGEATQLGDAGQEAHNRISAAADDSKKAISDFASESVERYSDTTKAALQTADQVDDLTTSIKAVPRDAMTKFEMIGLEQAQEDIAQYLADLKNIPKLLTTNIRVVVTGTGEGEPEHSLKLQHSIEDIYDLVQKRGAIQLHVMMAAESIGPSGKLKYQELIEAYYAALEDVGPVTERWEERIGRVFGSGGLWEMIQAQWAQKGVGELSLQHLLDTEELELPRWDLLTGSPEEAETEWRRFWDEIKSLEDERHSRAIAHLEKEERTTEKDWMKEKFQAAIEAEHAKHDQIMLNYDAEMLAADRLFEKRDVYNKRVAEALKAAQDAIKEQQKLEQDSEKSAHDQAMGLLEAEATRRKRLHDDVLSDIEERKRVENEAFTLATAALDEQARQIKERTDATAREISTMKLDLEEAEVRIDIKGAKAKLDELRDAADSFLDLLGDLDEIETDPRKAAEDERERQKAKVKLTTDAQKEMLRRYRDLAAEEDKRTIDLLLAGYNQRKVDVDRIMADLGARLSTEADAQQGVVDAKQAELDKMKQAIDFAEQKAKREKMAADDQLKVIEELKRQNSEAHSQRLRDLDVEKRAEDERYKAESQAIADMKTAEKDRHEARLKAINEQYALELLKLGKTDEEVAAILAEQSARAAAIAEEAQRRYNDAVAQVDAESQRLQGEQAGREEAIRQRIEAERAAMIQRLISLAQSLGGEAGAAIADLLRTLLSGQDEIIRKWVIVGEEGVKAMEAISASYHALINDQIRIDASKKRAAEPAERRYRLPTAKLGQTTRRGRGGFRAGHDWERWHGVPIEETAAAVGTKLNNTWPGPGSTGAASGAASGAAAGGAAGAVDPWALFTGRAKEAGEAVLSDFINPVNTGLVEMARLLRDLAGGLGELPPRMGLPILPPGSSAPSGPGGAGVTWNQYGDVNSLDASDAPGEFVDALLGLVGLHSGP